MDEITSASEEEQALQRLIEFTKIDPENIALLVDACNQAYQLGRDAELEVITNRYHALGHQLPSAVENLVGLAHLRARRFSQAINSFEIVLQVDDNAQVRYNAAYAQIMLEQYEPALAFLDDSVVASVAAGAALKVRCLHHLHHLEDALAFGQAQLNGTGDEDLRAALSLVALDLGRWDLVERLSDRSSALPDSLIARSALYLRQGNAAHAAPLLEQAIAKRPDSPRAWLGAGMVALLHSDFGKAGPTLERAAGLARTHLGSWVGAGWAYILDQKLDDADRCIDHAVQLDPRFSESQGAKAVLAVLRGDFDSGRRLCERALRLDRRCLSAAYARILILQHDGKSEAAAAMHAMTLEAQVGSDGQTLAQAIFSMGMKRR
jgi:tetratricopeptide (TPR) repeat protein